MAFHVLESARVIDHPFLATTSTDGNNGAFFIDSPEPGWRLALICSDGSDPTVAEKWEHVSVHAFRGHEGPTLRIRTPTWREMAFVKDLCWDGEDVVMIARNLSGYSNTASATTDTAPKNGAYTETRTAKMINGTGEGLDANGAPFVLTGTVTVTGKANLQLQP